MDVWECDLVYDRALAKHTDDNKYILTLIVVFSKFLHIVPLKSKTGSVVTQAFRSLLEDPTHSNSVRKRPIWVRTDRGKKFLTLCNRAMIKVVFSITLVNARSRLSSFFHASFFNAFVTKCNLVITSTLLPTDAGSLCLQLHKNNLLRTPCS
jgi:hypothetical protein